MRKKVIVIIVIGVICLVLGTSTGLIVWKVTSSKKHNSSSVSSSNSSLSSASSSSVSSSQNNNDEETKEAYEGYYKSLVSWENGEDLKNQLYDIIRSGYTPLAYTGNWESNQNADESLFNSSCVDLVYTDVDFLKTETNSGSFGWNREHAFCASLMCGKNTTDATKTKGRATDFHNLFASDSTGNQSRGNKNFGYANKNDASYNDKTKSKIINGNTVEGYDGYSYDLKNFEPGDKDKGRLARAIFYMATMYKNDEGSLKGLSVVDEYVEYDKTNCKFQIGNKQDLLKWNNDIDVDKQEILHNEKVYSTKVNGVAQGNRNPYVDYPELVDYAFGDKINEKGKLSDLTPSCSSYPCNKELSNYSIKQLKTEYYVGEEIMPSDYEVYKNYNDFSKEITSLKPLNYTFTSQDVGRNNINLKVEGDEIQFRAIVKEKGINECNYIFNCKNGISGSPGQDNIVNLNGVNWNVRFNKGTIGQYTESKGLQFGTTKLPPEKVVFETKDEFSYNSKNKIEAIYFLGNIGSDSSYTLKISVGDNVILSSSMKYDGSAPVQYGKELAEPLQGKIKIEIEGSKKACYVHSIGVKVS